MGPAMASVEFKYLVRDQDRHGNWRVYVRVPGKAKVRQDLTCRAISTA